MSLYQDNEFKYVAVINAKVPLERVLNGAFHATLGLAQRGAENAVPMEFLDYDDRDRSGVRKISRAPFVLLKAENSNQLRRLRREAREAGVLANDFADSMMGSSAQEQLEQTAARPEAEIDYYAVVLYGSSEKLKPLTKRFSVFK